MTDVVRVEGLDRLADQLRIQNAILFRLVAEQARANMIAQGRYPGEAPKGALAGIVEDNALDLEQRVDLEAVDRVTRD